MHIIIMCVCLINRYSAVRRQFGPTPDEELPVLEYQLQVATYSMYACMYMFMYMCVCVCTCNAMYDVCMSVYSV